MKDTNENKIKQDETIALMNLLSTLVVKCQKDEGGTLILEKMYGQEIRKTLDGVSDVMKAVREQKEKAVDNWKKLEVKA